jgi:hypothetical protein
VLMGKSSGRVIRTKGWRWRSTSGRRGVRPPNSWWRFLSLRVDRYVSDSARFSNRLLDASHRLKHLARPKLLLPSICTNSLSIRYLDGHNSRRRDGGTDTARTPRSKEAGQRGRLYDYGCAKIATQEVDETVSEKNADAITGGRHGGKSRRHRARREVAAAGPATDRDTSGLGNLGRERWQLGQ